MDIPNVLGQLLKGRRVSLADWMAAPCRPDEARALLGVARRALGSGCHEARERFNLNLAALICHYWAGDDVDGMCRTLLACTQDPEERALLELCCGQLFIACRYQPAWTHLDRGFELAAHLLSAEAYFLVLKRHALLRHLPLSPKRLAPVPLEDLLNEARVIERLEGGKAGVRHRRGDVR